jgi:protein-tyrosine phosphatase
MTPLVDVHCHLLAGLDDGPRSDEDALEMCRIAYAAGTRIIDAGAHQNHEYPDNNADRLRAAALALAQRLKQEKIGLTTYACGEVMVSPEMAELWQQGVLLSVADKRQFLLVEYPHAGWVDLTEMVQRFRAFDVRFILAHPERCPELLYHDERSHELLRAGCLIQVSAGSITRPRDRGEEKALKHWLQDGFVHLLGSDGHDPKKRRPVMQDAYQQMVNWIGAPAADRIASVNGMAVSQGTRLNPPLPQRKAASWFSKWW